MLLIATLGTTFWTFLLIPFLSDASTTNYNVTSECLGWVGKRLIYIYNGYDEDSYGTITAQFQNRKVDCTIQLGTTFFTLWRLIVIVKSLDVRPGCQDTLRIADHANRTLESFCNRILAGTDPPTIETNGQSTIAFTTGSGDPGNTSFEVMFNAYEYIWNCKQFGCSNGRCIAKALQCNGYDNCGDWSDERDCDEWPQFCRNDRTKIIRVPSLLRDASKASGFIGTTKYGSSSSCAIVLVPSANERLMLSARKIDLRYGCTNSITVTYLKEAMNTTTTAIFCEYINEDYGRDFINSASNITITFESKYSLIESFDKFEFLFAAYRYGTHCETDMFRCKQNNHCISKFWKCDGYNQCGDGSDEQDCESTSIATYIGYAILALVLLLMLIGGIACFRKKCNDSSTTSSHVSAPRTNNVQPATDFEQRFTAHFSNLEIQHQNVQTNDPTNDIPPKYHEVCAPPPDYNQVDGIVNAGFELKTKKG